MHRFRFNPAWQQWVLLGGAVLPPSELHSAHFLEPASSGQFLAASFPQSPLVLDRPSHFAVSSDLLYAEMPALGEYELLLYRGEEDFWQWSLSTWDSWLQLLQHRLRLFAHNPNLLHGWFSLNTACLADIQDFAWVGELLATRQAVFGLEPQLTAQIAEKLLTQEKKFVIRELPTGSLYLPTAPTELRELWYLPKTEESGFEQVEKASRLDLAKTLAELLPALQKLDSQAAWEIRLHSQLPGSSGKVWWWQIFESGGSDLVRPLPEQFRQQLSYVL